MRILFEDQCEGAQYPVMLGFPCPIDGFNGTQINTANQMEQTRLKFIHNGTLPAGVGGHDWGDPAYILNKDATVDKGSLAANITYWLQFTNELNYWYNQLCNGDGNPFYTAPGPFINQHKNYWIDNRYHPNGIVALDTVVVKIIGDNEGTPSLGTLPNGASCGQFEPWLANLTAMLGNMTTVARFSASDAYSAGHGSIIFPNRAAKMNITSSLGSSPPSTMTYSDICACTVSRQTLGVFDNNEHDCEGDVCTDTFTGPVPALPPEIFSASFSANNGPPNRAGEGICVNKQGRIQIDTSNIDGSGAPVIHSYMITVPIGIYATAHYGQFRPTAAANDRYGEWIGTGFAVGGPNTSLIYVTGSDVTQPIVPTGNGTTREDNWTLPGQYTVDNLGVITQHGVIVGISMP